MPVHGSTTASGLQPGEGAVLRERLTRLLGPEAVLGDERVTAYRLAGRVPALAVRPPVPEAVAAVLAIADELGAAVVPWGGGTAQAIGYPPRAFDLALDVRALAHVLHYEPADLTLSVQAGITLAAIDRLLGEHGQRLSLDGARPEHATLGGIVAANLAGPRRLRYGTARDALIGVCAALTDGTLAHGGGRVVKNVSGYDMMKLFLGSLGTLGVLVELNFKVLPRPAREVALALGFETAGAALDAVAALLDSVLQPVAAIVLDPALAPRLVAGARGWTLVVGFEGAPATTARQVREVRERAAGWCGAVVCELEGAAAGVLWRQLAEYQQPDVEPVDRALVKVVVSPSEVGAVLDATTELAAAAGIALDQAADAAVGLVYWRLKRPEGLAPEAFGQALATVQQGLVQRFEQSVVLSCPAGVKPHLPLWGREPSGIAVMRAIKQQFDPHGILNPGRFVGGI
ncbi:MAG: FAD-binding oxidoreductase [Chloroflexi bacterium]|nr:FAD-binding oxidoreductase [Chloroflexota bacterium]